MSAIGDRGWLLVTWLSLPKLRMVGAVIVGDVAGSDEVGDVVVVVGDAVLC